MADNINKLPSWAVENQDWYKDYAKQMTEANKDGWHPQPDPGKGRILNLNEAETLPKEPASSGSYASAVSPAGSSNASFAGSGMFAAAGGRHAYTGSGLFPYTVSAGSSFPDDPSLRTSGYAAYPWKYTTSGSVAYPWKFASSGSASDSPAGSSSGSFGYGLGLI